MEQCECGRGFASAKSLAQHRRDIVANGRSCHSRLARHVSNHGTEKKNWMRRDAADTKPFEVIRSENIEIAAAAVTTAAFELVCTYNWQEHDSLKASVPGHAPLWQPPSLPFEIPKDDSSIRVKEGAVRLPEYPFEIVFRATEIVNPQFSFHDVDVVVNRNSLRKLLEFCDGKVSESFKVNLLLVKNTLFIERCESSAVKLLYGSAQSGWGRNFEKACTTSKGRDESQGHHRVLCYPIGEIRCVVRFEVDACYNSERGRDIDMTLLAKRIGDLAMSTCSGKATMPQSAAAEIKSTQKSKSPKKYLAQLWFGRTPWLLIGKHTKGRFESMDVLDVSKTFPQWEETHQTKLRKLATLLQQLRSAVQSSGGQNCIAVCEKPPGSRAIEIFTSQMERGALPAELQERFWPRNN
ncbi:hypothetical protein PWT90_06884 [Aphanocladium album]|nr:hypothetical protein PWT90_06884 [Aphanocladium album]